MPERPQNDPYVNLRINAEQARALYVAAVQKRNATRGRGRYEGTDAEQLALLIPRLADIGWPDA